MTQVFHPSRVEGAFFSNFLGPPGGQKFLPGIWVRYQDLRLNKRLGSHCPEFPGNLLGRIRVPWYRVREKPKFFRGLNFSSKGGEAKNSVGWEEKTTRRTKKQSVLPPPHPPSIDPNTNEHARCEEQRQPSPQKHWDRKLCISATKKTWMGPTVPEI